MRTFKEYNSTIEEGRYPGWLKGVVLGISMKITSLSNRIKNEKDPVVQNQLISQQNKYLSYITGLGIGVNTKNPTIIQRFKPNPKGGR